MRVTTPQTDTDRIQHNAEVIAAARTRLIDLKLDRLGLDGPCFGAEFDRALAAEFVIRREVEPMSHAERVALLDELGGEIRDLDLR